MATDTKREVLGAVVRGFVATANQLDLTAKLIPMVSEASGKLLKDPPLHVTWVPGPVYEELFVALGKLGGPPLIRKFGRDLVYTSAGPVLRPLLKTLMNLFGGGPAALLKNLNRAIPLQYRGLSFEYQPENDRGGIVIIDYGGPVDPILFHAWEGSFEFGSEITGTKVEVGTAVALPGGRSGRVPVKW